MFETAKLKNSQNPLRVIVVGAGFGRYGHLPAYQIDPQFEVVGVYGSTPQSTKRFEEMGQVQNQYDTLKDALKDPQVHWVSVACPPQFQLDIAEQAIRSGKAVFLEKPLGADLKSCEKFVSLIHKENGFARVNFIFPQLKVFQGIKSAIADGKIGDVRHFFIDWRMQTHDIAKNLSTWKTDEDLGGGLLSHFISHCFFYSEWLFGEINQFEKTTFKQGSFRSMSLLSATMMTASGVSGSLTASNVAAGGSGHSFEIVGSRGTLRAVNSTQDAVTGFKLYFRASAKEDFSLLCEEPLNYPKLDARVVPTHANILDLAGQFNSQSPNFDNIEAALRVQRFLSENF